MPNQIEEGKKVIWELDKTDCPSQKTSRPKQVHRLVEIDKGQPFWIRCIANRYETPHTDFTMRPHDSTTRLNLWKVEGVCSTNIITSLLNLRGTPIWRNDYEGSFSEELIRFIHSFGKIEPIEDSLKYFKTKLTVRNDKIHRLLHTLWEPQVNKFNIPPIVTFSPHRKPLCLPEKNQDREGISKSSLVVHLVDKEPAIAN